MTLRDKIIYILESRKGEFISGQEMADSVNVSRSAVAKCVSQLKNDGYLIKSVNNLGHSLDMECDIISEYGIRAYLGEDQDMEIKTFKTIDSTNSEAKRAISSGSTSEGIFAADHQTEGRGRRGKSFYSPEKSGLYFTMVLHPQTGIADATGITAAAAVATVEVIRQETKKDPKIKWVNDIFIENKKVCGILTEAIADFESDRVEAVIVGIGINLTTDHFPAELENIAGNAGKMNRCKIAALIFRKLKEYCDALPKREFMEKYRKYSLVLGKEITFIRNGINYSATAENILDDGSLEVVTDRGERMVLSSGEISIKPK